MVSLWDTAGQEDFDRIRVLAYDKTDILLMTFCIVSRNTFRNVKDLWMKELEKNRAKFINATVRRLQCTPHPPHPPHHTPPW